MTDLYEELGHKEKRAKETKDINSIMTKRSIQAKFLRYGALIASSSFVLWIIVWSISLFIRLRSLKKENAALLNNLIHIQKKNNDMNNEYQELLTIVEVNESKQSVTTCLIEDLMRRQETSIKNTNELKQKVYRANQELIILDETNDNLTINNRLKEREIRNVNENIKLYELKIKEIKDKIAELASHG